MKTASTLALHNTVTQMPVLTRIPGVSGAHDRLRFNLTRSEVIQHRSIASIHLVCQRLRALGAPIYATGRSTTGDMVRRLAGPQCADGKAPFSVL